MELSDIGTQQAKPIEATANAINQLLGYVATYLTDGITYRASNMHISAHSDAAYLNVSKARRCDGAHIFLYEDEPKPQYNGTILTLSKIIKPVMSSDAEAKISAVFITAKDMVPQLQTVIKMKWPNGMSTIQNNNSTSMGVTNKTIVPKCTKSMYMIFNWLCCRMVQGQFRFYWGLGTENFGNYSTKYHPPLYHNSLRPTRAG